jgi:peptide/nickel transport system ATP-binding protein
MFIECLMTPLLQVHNLTKHYPVMVPDGWRQRQVTLRAVDGISFDLHAGKTLGLVGESGCGKTTTARLVLGLMEASQGQILFEGHALSAERDSAWRLLRQRMQMVYQNPLSALDRRLPVLTQVTEPLRIHGRGDPLTYIDQAQELMNALGLSPALWHRYPHELSGGQRQRVVLSRALILKPSLLVCDEPVSALDVSIQAQVINLLQDIQERMGVAYLFISHDLKVVHQVSDDVGVMYLGKMVEQGPPEELFSEPLHPYTQALLDAIPKLWQREKATRLTLQGEPPSPLMDQQGCVFQQRCPHVQAICKEKAPEWVRMTRTRSAACHLLTPSTSQDSSLLEAQP